MKISFSPPDMSELEVQEVSDTIRSGWITTGPRTKEFEHLLAMCCGTDKVVCLNSATACMELILRVLGIGPGDEVITSANTQNAVFISILSDFNRARGETYAESIVERFAHNTTWIETGDVNMRQYLSHA